MKAIVVREFGPPEVMRLEESEAPRASAGQVVVRVHAAGVNPVDTYIRSGTYAKKPPLPYTPGSDAAGVVEEAGGGVGRLRAGDRVYVAGSLTGTYAELALCEEWQAHALPPGVTFEQGAGVYVPYATAYRALFQRGQARAGEWVLVHGASGGVGVAAVQLARAAGLVVVGTGGTERGRGLAAAEGAHHVLDHRAEGYLERDLSLLARGGRVVVVGNRGTIEINPRALMSRDADVRGMSLLNAPPEELSGVHAALVAGLEAGTLRPVVGRSLPLAEAARAHAEVLEPGAYGKIVLVP